MIHTKTPTSTGYNEAIELNDSEVKDLLAAHDIFMTLRTVHRVKDSRVEFAESILKEVLYGITNQQKEIVKFDLWEQDIPWDGSEDPDKVYSVWCDDE